MKAGERCNEQRSISDLTKDLECYKDRLTRYRSRLKSIEEDFVIVAEEYALMHSKLQDLASIVVTHNSDSANFKKRYGRRTGLKLNAYGKVQLRKRA